MNLIITRNKVVTSEETITLPEGFWESIWEDYPCLSTKPHPYDLAPELPSLLVRWNDILTQ